LNAAYDGTLASLDHQLGLLFAELDRRAELANTIVVITSDHGELFGEHGLMEHSNSLYLDVLHVPLVIVHPPKVPANVRVPQRVSLRDLPETMIDLAGLAETHAFPGASLARMWAATPPAQDVVLSETNQAHSVYPDSYPARKGRMQSLFTGDFHYIKNLGDGREELYDLAADPRELRDLSSERKDALQSYRDQLTRMLVPSVPSRRPSGAPAGRPGGD
jgi:arylsulfatase A-like enzyme